MKTVRRSRCPLPTTARRSSPEVGVDLWRRGTYRLARRSAGADYGRESARSVSGRHAQRTRALRPPLSRFQRLYALTCVPTTSAPSP